MAAGLSCRARYAQGLATVRVPDRQWVIERPRAFVVLGENHLDAGLVGFLPVGIYQQQAVHVDAISRPSDPLSAIDEAEYQAVYQRRMKTPSDGK